MFGLPSLERIIILAVVPPLIGFVIIHRWQTWEAYVTFFSLIFNSGYGIVTWFALAYSDWQSGYKKPETSIPLIPALNDMPPVKGFALELQGVKIDKVRLFNRALIHMRNSNLDVNMTEAFWLEKVGDEHRWNKIGGTGRTDFVDMLDRGIRFGAYKVVGGQGKRVPNDWRLIRMLEQGTPLPH